MFEQTPPIQKPEGPPKPSIGGSSAFPQKPQSLPPPRPPIPPPPPKPPLPPRPIEIPPSAVKPKEPAPVIHTIPFEYYGVLPKTVVKKVAPIIPPPQKPPPPPKTSSTPFPVKKKKIPMAVIIGAAFLAVIAVGGFLFLRSLTPPEPSVATNQPPPPPPPPATVCGNAICETGETQTLCPADCLPPPPPPLPPIRGGIDSDSDGLTDLEETSIYQSNPQNPDSDGDSFIDGNEVFHVYDPTKPSPASLDDHPQFNSAKTVSVLVPKGWVENSEGGGAAVTTFAMTSGEQVVVETALVSGQSLTAWASERYPTILFTPFHSKRANLAGLRSADQRLIIIEMPAEEGSSEFLSFKYQLGERRTIEFLRTFEMVVNSFFPYF